MKEFINLKNLVNELDIDNKKLKHFIFNLLDDYERLIKDYNKIKVNYKIKKELLKYMKYQYNKETNKKIYFIDEDEEEELQSDDEYTEEIINNFKED